ncbi:MAG: cytochrome ubiquinol oxidase subunit I [Candidatus Latescibacteria bacterium]|nr:cytochrome ubiquinol oxidase subunit I [Candidatus Latescibacterota bacterium]NIO57361.1 cytochrome ubiquinol oxidase subunit I [Candidatus Latescibacterota bacterium]
MFHYIFPPLTIGLGALLVIMESTYMVTKDPRYRAMAKFWTKIFAVSFAMGVASGIVMEFQFGTNWATYSRYVGDVFGSALAAEGIFAFFLESGFLAVLVFGWDRVSDRMHWFSTLMVALGAVFSAIWIVVANSWQQTPAGFHIVGEGIRARAEITDFWTMVFNPSTVHRLLHVLIGAYILGGFFVMSVSAFYVLKKRHLDLARKTFVLGLIVATIFSFAALVSGHFQAVTVSDTQPAKLAAFEGHFHTGTGGSPMTLWGIVDEEEEAVKYSLAIPGLLSWLVSGDASKPITGLDAFSEADRPPVSVPFYTYHLMIALGMYFIFLCLLAWFFYWRRTLFATRWLLWVFVFSVVGPFLANQGGWVAAEVGRQPWIVHKLLRTSDALSKVVRAEQVLASIVLFAVIYIFLFLVWITVLNRKIKAGPGDELSEVEPDSEKWSWIDAAAVRAAPGETSMTGATAEPAERKGS